MEIGEAKCELTPELRTLQRDILNDTLEYLRTANRALGDYLADLQRRCASCATLERWCSGCVAIMVEVSRLTIQAEELRIRELDVIRQVAEHEEAGPKDPGSAH